ncbi:hypothetical protein B0A48_13311 [Cryoendolithus antarcticus]|uniref:Major facilitator superfamily (MFS) profile domain-containing protein n=1 Tax=Cryoendolithus antarcticus TaxID=1507870 RepID=A0A1V8SPW7_9PEZI|nr:hypothetical protein B0A48_13311 [Cryoendolithus antarcticus]
MPRRQAVSERTPLLDPSDDIRSDVNQKGEQARAGDASESAKAPVGDADSDGSALERQTSLQVKNDGMPEVRKRMKYIFPALAIGVFLSAADQTIIVSSYGKIGSELHALNLTSWIATAYFLTLTSFQPLYGKLSDIFGRKACILSGYFLFGIGCLLCGLAQDIDQLIGARAFAGIGGGGMTTVVSILLSDVVPLRERGTWQGYVNIIYALGASAGAPLGGFLADSVGWRWAFLIQAPMCLAAFIAVSFALHLPKTGDSHWREKLKRIDFLGALILIGAVFTLLLALDRGSNVSWGATITLVSLAISIPLFTVFVLVEMYVAKEPFAPGHIIFNRTLFACYLCNFFAFAGWLAAIFYIPLYFQVVNDMSATQAGLRLIPSIIAGVSGSLFAGFYMQRTGRYYWLTIIAYNTLVLGMIVITLVAPAGLHANVVLFIIIGLCMCGFSNGIGVTSTLIGLIANASKEDQAVATACSYLFRSLGSVFGVAISATVANQELRKYLAAELPKHHISERKAIEIADRVRQSLEYLRQLKPEIQDVVREGYSASIDAAFVVQIGLVAGAALSAWLIKEKALSR